MYLCVFGMGDYECPQVGGKAVCNIIVCCQCHQSWVIGTKLYKLKIFGQNLDNVFPIRLKHRQKLNSSKM